MKLNDIIKEFDIYKTNEEKKLLEEMETFVPIEMFNEREKVILQSLIRKSCITKFVRDNKVFVCKNEGV